MLSEIGYSASVRYPDIDPTEVKWQVRSYFDVINELLDHARRDQPALIAIDGHSGSGKTSLAAGLAALEPGTVIIHTDDLAWGHSFFDWADILTEKLVIPFCEGRTPIMFRPEARTCDRRPRAISIPSDTTTVLVEGVGAARREVRPWLDAVVWVYARAEVGRRRMVAKGWGSSEFIDQRMQTENAFLDEHRPWEIADVLVAGELGQPSRRGRYGNVVTAAEAPSRPTRSR